MIVWALMICIAVPQTEAKAAPDKCEAYRVYQSRTYCAERALGVAKKLMGSESRWYSPEVTRVFCERHDQP